MVILTTPPLLMRKDLRLIKIASNYQTVAVLSRDSMAGLALRVTAVAGLAHAAGPAPGDLLPAAA